jgi:hypothetical protein
MIAATVTLEKSLLSSLFQREGRLLEPTLKKGAARRTAGRGDLPGSRGARVDFA